MKTTRNMLTVVMVMAAIGLAGGSASGDVLLYEPFDYPDEPLNGKGGALGTTGTWTTNDTGFAQGWWCHPEGGITGQFDDIGGGFNTFDGTVANLPTAGGFVGAAGPVEQGGTWGTRDPTGNMDANIGLAPSVTATFQPGTTTWFSYVGAHADNRNQGSPTFMLCTDPTTNGSRGLTMQNSGNGIGGVGGPTRYNLWDVYPHYFSGGVHHQTPGGYLAGVFGGHDGIVTSFCSTSTCDGVLDESGQPRTQTMAWQVSDADGFGAPNIVVGKIQWDADTSGEDIISVVRFLETEAMTEAAFDALVAALPPLSSANWASNKPDLDQSQFDTLNISSLKFYVDELRIGTTFGDIIGAVAQQGSLHILKFLDIDGDGEHDPDEPLLEPGSFQFEIVDPTGLQTIVSNCEEIPLEPGVYTGLELLEGDWFATTPNPFQFEIFAGELYELYVGNRVPEPATLALLGLAACGLGGYVRKRRTG